MRIFLAGATGAIGRHLVPQLINAGHRVTATTHSESKVALLWNLGAEPVVVDGLDAAAIGDAVARAGPEVVIHQMTGLSALTNLKHFDREFAETNRLRIEGLDHLLAAARATGTRRIIAQSFTGWPNIRSGSAVKTEADPLDPSPPKEQRRSIAAIRHVEHTVVNSPLEGVVLRYGTFYGNGVAQQLFDAITKRQLPIVGGGGATWSWIHIEDAAAATVAAVEHGSGIYNIVDDDPTPVREMIPALAELLGAKPPRHVPVRLARVLAGDVGVSMLTQIRGSSNAKARRELGWAPHWTSWRDGVRHELETAVVAG
ncbi:MAG TPA: NAD(P)-dependent oxidoreductase [Jatrophihabitantaceae bacterium]|jgi:nucleoside-diphosphate-sugar epimerase|nr:NAD(P)-dependent oxidoreductase [Jatrophihabitantaceae bacterium]